MTDPIREIAFDTETTGLKHAEGDRIIEMGAVELLNHIPTGNTFRTLINPKRLVSADTVRITGITDDHLKDAPFFEDPLVVNAFLEFVGDDIIVAHNAGFDRGFLNMELALCGRAPIHDDRWVDTAAMARRKYPGAPASLDALCKRFDISLESRTLHGALLDSQLLASVYLELLGGRARAFAFDTPEDQATAGTRRPASQRPQPLPPRITEAEAAAHAEFIESLGPDTLWKRA
ncbi:DNA polymerase III subunit epsilon [Hyphomonas johnsonii]|uniref:DNA polymerase III subunit epsilon n=1 Tax=Hyphomonas johnsonii MHS-2 TaxID=1280950 RepID=A0A059FM60_9PROT|nr:DNA polymerase III subunit epsilon [Hyphomonas johnsonii]KCZ91775.1 DNA polymerase III subunit epsilon [Hyphomonas johnsonii MHS-2]